VAQNVYKNKNLQGEFSDPDSPYYQGDGSRTDENGQPIGNCVEINAGCTAGQEEIEDYIGDEIIIIGSSGESLYYYHPDHLGSASVITDGSGNLREHIEYFAFGETWVQEGASKKTPYMYTGKELDQETGLYYYGARYYDPRTSVWQSVDPILEKYLPSGDPEKDKNLPGMGGFFNSGNLAGYTQSHNNPVRYVDPDGNAVNYDGNVLFNGALINAIEKFNTNLGSFLETDNSNFEVKIRGGDRFLNDNKVFSMSNGNPINTSTNTSHAVENDARGVDFRLFGEDGVEMDLDYGIVKHLLKESGFSVEGTNFQTPDDYPKAPHFHANLLKTPENAIHGIMKGFAEFYKNEWTKIID